MIIRKDDFFFALTNYRYADHFIEVMHNFSKIENDHFVLDMERVTQKFHELTGLTLVVLEDRPNFTYRGKLIRNKQLPFKDVYEFINFVVPVISLNVDQRDVFSIFTNMENSNYSSYGAKLLTLSMNAAHQIKDKSYDYKKSLSVSLQVANEEKIYDLNRHSDSDYLPIEPLLGKFEEASKILLSKLEATVEI